MSGSQWRFLLDENVSRRVERELDGRGYSAEHVVDALNPGVDDLSDILPYARQHDLVIVTKDYSDFGDVGTSDHEGVILIADHTHPPYLVGDAVANIVAAYPSRDAFRSQCEFLGDWVPE